MTVTVTLQYPDSAAAAEALARLAGVIPPADRPDAGASVRPHPAPSTVAVDPAAVFAGAPISPPVVPPAPVAPPTLPADAASAPSAATVPTVAPSTSGPERDSAGLIWDSRIHSETRTRNKDGTWRQKRGVDAGLLTKVLAEIGGGAAAPTGTAVVAPPAPVAAVVAPPAPVAAVVAPPAPVAPAVPAGVAVPMSFPDLMRAIGPYLALPNGVGTQASADACSHPMVGIPAVGSLAARPEIVPIYWEAFLEALRAKGVAA